MSTFRVTLLVVISAMCATCIVRGRGPWGFRLRERKRLTCAPRGNARGHRVCAPYESRHPRTVQHSELGPANSHRVFEHGIEDWLQLPGRGADDFEHIGCSGLLLQ